MKNPDVPALKIPLLAVLFLLLALIIMLCLPEAKHPHAPLASNAPPLVRHSPIPVVRRVQPGPATLPLRR